MTLQQAAGSFIFEEEFDKASYRATQQYFNEHPGLIQRIKHKLEGGKLRWKLKNLKHRLLPHLLENHIKDLSLSSIEMDIIAKSQFEKYRHLEKGIMIVEEMGYMEAIKLYIKDPILFRKLLI
jgi:hypothetical protein